MRKSIVVISNLDNMTYFFSTNHCQEHGLGECFVPCSHAVPMYVEPRPCVPNGVVRNVTDLVAVFYDDMQEIPNPDTNFQPKF